MDCTLPGASRDRFPAGRARGWAGASRIWRPQNRYSALMIRGAATLSPRARVVRAALIVLGIGLLIAGTLVGDDYAFPFGPFRMYSTSTPPNGHMAVVVLEARTAGGTWRRTSLSSWNVGVNRAEVEGQIPRFRAHPELLRDIVLAHGRLRPREPRWMGARLIMHYLILRDRRVVGTKDRVIVEWSER